MATGDTYATLDELKSYMSLVGQSGLDEQMTDALRSASREIERYTKRQFNTDVTVSVRLYRPSNRYCLSVDDFSTATGLIVKTDNEGDGVFETTWASTDYELYPVNAPLDGWPYTKIQSTGTKWFPTYTGKGQITAQITALFGWKEVPPPVKQACLVLAAANFQLKDAPLGIAGMGEFGVLRVRDSQTAASKLKMYCRHNVWCA